MAQTGDPTGTGTGGSGQKLRAEFNTEPHTRGAVSMARAQNPDSADSQFFICFDEATFLDRQYTVWGRVIEGMENVDKITRGEPPPESGQDPERAGRRRRGVMDLSPTIFVIARLDPPARAEDDGGSYAR